MTPLFAYLLKVIVCSAILYGYYLVALRNKVFHSWNRFYLMACMVLSILLPLMEPYIIAPASNESKVITALQVVAGADEYVMDLQGNASMSWDVTLLMNAGYVLISLLVMGWLLFGLTSIYKMVRKYPKQKMQYVLFMNTQEPGTPFSYFRYLFWNKAIDPSSENGQKILEHELVHIREKHSYDKLFVHLVLTIYWANPFFWLIRKELAMVHEFIADQKTVSDTESFAQMILSASFPGHSNLLTNAFFQSSIKRRIAMITKNKNPKYQYISRILLIPVLFVLIFTFAVKADEFIHTPTVELDKKVTVVIDAGHGGQDAGATSGEIKEKDLNLALAKRIKELNTNSNIEIVLSRDADNTLPLTERTTIADKENADLFISLHTAASPNKNQQGIEAFVAKNNNAYSNESKDLATLLLNKLSNIYITDKSIKTRSMPIYVLEKNKRPSVVLESGYITNEKDKSFFSKEANRDKLAKAILQSIEDYFNKNVVIKNISLDTIPAAKKVKTVTVTYEDGSKENFNETEFLNRQIGKYKKVEGVEIKKITLKGNDKTLTSYLDELKFDDVYLDGEKVLIDTVDMKRIKRIEVRKNNNGKSKIFVHTNKENSSIEIVGVKLEPVESSNELAVVGNPKQGNNESKTDNVVVVTGYAKSSNPTNSRKKVEGQRIQLPDPLYILDGKELNKRDFDSIDPNKIESVDVLKNESAIAQYGEKGKNGAIIIKLKKQS